MGMWKGPKPSPAGRQGCDVASHSAGGHLSGAHHAKYQHVNCGKKLQEDWSGTKGMRWCKEGEL